MSQAHRFLFNFGIEFPGIRLISGEFENDFLQSSKHFEMVEKGVAKARDDAVVGVVRFLVMFDVHASGNDYSHILQECYDAIRANHVRLFVELLGQNDEQERRCVKCGKLNGDVDERAQDEQ